MSAVSDAFTSFQTALTTKLQTAGSGQYLPITGGRIMGQLEVNGDILAAGDIDGDQVFPGPYPTTPSQGGHS